MATLNKHLQLDMIKKILNYKIILTDIFNPFLTSENYFANQFNIITNGVDDVIFNKWRFKEVNNQLQHTLLVNPEYIPEYNPNKPPFLIFTLPLTNYYFDEVINVYPFNSITIQESGTITPLNVTLLSYGKIKDKYTNTTFTFNDSLSIIDNLKILFELLKVINLNITQSLFDIIKDYLHAMNKYKKIKFTNLDFDNIYRDVQSEYVSKFTENGKLL